MKKNYKKLILTVLMAVCGLLNYGQDIHFTFANAQITNDGTNDHYEVDVMIQTINTTGSFKLGSGQLYFNYNTAAFGQNVQANARFVVTQPNADGYICGQYIDFGSPFFMYGPFTVNDNSTSRVSWAFSQAYSSSTIANDNVNSTPQKLCHLDFTFVDSNADPMLQFEDGSTYDDQFFTACGSAGGGIVDTADCGGYPGTNLTNDTFDSGGATLSVETKDLSNELAVYPNPARDIIYLRSGVTIKKVEMFDMLGKLVLETDMNSEIKVNHLEQGIYLLKAYSEIGSSVKKVVID
ncbi:T9SS type A sorting domain-containing protein [Gaetbulibacter aestuarii]|uniref:T9SS type A sorting domain-containing protein n=1 Tax=Gaetbulibacter aestuarii TaxID=1502358 RepID=A0ABW7N3S3_9FLAO